MKLERSDATVAGVEEPCRRAFAPSFLLSGLDPSLREGHPRLAMPLAHQGSGKAMSSIHSWLLRLQGKTISAALLGLCQSAAPTVQPIPHDEVAASRNLGAAGVKPEDLIL